MFTAVGVPLLMASISGQSWEIYVCKLTQACIHIQIYFSIYLVNIYISIYVKWKLSIWITSPSF